MGTIIIIVGLPGSGKTFLAQSYRDDGYLIFDDIGFSSSKEEALTAIASGQDCVLIDPYFCNSEIRSKLTALLLSFPIDLQWIYFENNPSQCLQNVTRRNDGRKVNNFIRAMSKQYVIPSKLSEKDLVFPVFTPEKD